MIVYAVRFDARHGVGTAAIRLAEDLAALGHPVRVFAARAEPSTRRGIHVWTLPVHLPYSIEMLLMGLISAAHSRLHKGVTKHAIELPAESAWIHIHGDPWDATKTTHRRGLRAAGRRSATRVVQRAARNGLRSGRIVTPSTSLAVRLAKAIPVAFAVLPNALPIDDPVLLATDESVDLRRIGFVAQGDLGYKGLVAATEALSVLGADFRLEVAGVTILPADMVSAGVQTRAIGNLERDRFRSWLASCAGVIIASSYESFSLVALEAAILGRPMLALGELGISEYFENQELGLFTGEQVAEWVRALTSEGSFRPQLNNDLARRRIEVLKRLT